MILWLVSVLTLLLGALVAAGPPTSIPDEMGLPHQWTWRDSDPSRPLSDFCLDPQDPGLRPVPPSDVRGRTDTGRLETLGVYATAGRATRAMAVWRRQIATCADGTRLNHVGGRFEWRVLPVTVEGADEAWQAVELSSDTLARDGRLVVSSETAVRVGNAVYVESTRRSLGSTGLSARLHREVASVASYVPELQVFGD